MNKNELIRELQLSRGGSFSDAKDFLEAFIKIVTTELGHDGEINLQGFGSLKPWHQTLREGRNPKTGAAVTISPRISVKFRPGKYLLDALNKKE